MTAAASHALTWFTLVCGAAAAASVAFTLDGVPVVLRSGVHYFTDGLARLRADAAVRAACEQSGAGALVAAYMA